MTVAEISTFTPNTQEKPECYICLDDLPESENGDEVSKVTTLGCSHIFCSSCIEGWVNEKVKKKEQPHCPTCRSPIARDVVVLERTRNHQEVIALVDSICRNIRILNTQERREQHYQIAIRESTRLYIERIDENLLGEVFVRVVAQINESKSEAELDLLQQSLLNGRNIAVEDFMRLTTWDPQQQPSFFSSLTRRISSILCLAR